MPAYTYIHSNTQVLKCWFVYSYIYEYVRVGGVWVCACVGVVACIVRACACFDVYVRMRF